LSETVAMGRLAPSSVVLGLSSGVDSSIAAWLLKEQGYNVVGVTLALAEPGSDEQANSCCSPALMAKAKAIADHLGIPHYAVDEIQEFRGKVVDYFVSEYAAGRTPNPCAKCNSRVRFSALLDVARRLGASAVATGHYARLTGEPGRLSRGQDSRKDQSYVLAEVDAGLLEQCLFPLGELTKQQVRGVAADIGLGELVSRESQEICFVPGDDYRAFLKERLGERPGAIVDDQGRVLGQHSGTYNYTVGQRKGLGHAAGGPLYVASVDAERGEVVATRERGVETGIIGFALSALHREPPKGVVTVQFRSMGGAVFGRLVGLDSLVLDAPTRGVAPGQTVVVYDGEDVVLGGTITAAEPAGH
jgi:tRNA-specific 2-thiouridylase